MARVQKIAIYAVFIAVTLLYIHGNLMGFSWISNHLCWGAVLVVTGTALNAISRLEKRISFLEAAPAAASEDADKQ